MGNIQLSDKRQPLIMETIYNEDMFYKRLKETKTIHIILFLVGLLISLIVGIASIRNKRIFDIDESLSMSLANEQTIGWVEYEPHGWVTKDVFQRYIVTDHPFSYEQVIRNQAEDVHPPLYYLLLHTAYSFHPGASSLWIGLGINLFFYLMNCALLYWLLVRNTRSLLTPFVGMLLYAFNPIVIKLLTLLRMYQMVSTFSFLFLFFGTEIVIHRKPMYPALLITTILGGLTHYYFYYAVLCMCLVFGVGLLVQKRFLPFLYSVVCVGLGTVLNFFVFFPATRDHLFSSAANGSHGVYARESLSSGAFKTDTFRQFLDLTYGGKLIYYLSLILGIALLVIVLILTIRKTKINLLLKQVMALSGGLLLAYVGYVMLVSQTASYIEARYLIAGEIIGICGFLLTCGSLPYEAGVIPCLLICMLRFDSSLLYGNRNTIPSAQYASEEGGPLVVVMDEPLSTNVLGECYLDYLAYTATGFTSLNEELKGIYPEQFTVYYARSLSTESVESYICKQAGTDLQFTEHPEVITTEFNVLEVNREGN